jgi:hypothetical protein
MKDASLNRRSDFLYRFISVPDLPEMPLILCPGFHDSRLNDRPISFLKRAGFSIDRILPPFSTLDLSIPREPLTMIGFSAGVVTAMANATLWRASGGTIAAVFALDGWGVPLVGDFPIYRLSHDYFTHWSSGLLGGGAESFYADPAVDHLALWSSPDTVTGWSVSATGAERRDALTFLSERLAFHRLGIIN